MDLNTIILKLSKTKVILDRAYSYSNSYIFVQTRNSNTKPYLSYVHAQDFNEKNKCYVKPFIISFAALYCGSRQKPSTLNSLCISCNSILN